MRPPLDLRLLRRAREEGLTSTAALASVNRRPDSTVRDWFRGKGARPERLLDQSTALMNPEERIRFVQLFADEIGAAVVVLPATVVPAVEQLAGALRRAA